MKSLIGLLILFSLNAFGAVEGKRILTITNNEVDGSGKLIGEFNVLRIFTNDDGSIKGFIYSSHDKTGRLFESKPGEAIPKPLKFSASKLKNDQEVVLEKDHGIEAIRLSGKIDPYKGGTLKITFINQAGLLNEIFKSCKMKLVQNENQEWTLIHIKSNQPIKTAQIQVNSTRTGIETIAGICGNPPMPKKKQESTPQWIRDLPGFGTTLPN